MEANSLVCCELMIIVRSTWFSIKFTNVLANQHQSAKRPARSPVRFPKSPSLDKVAVSSATPLTNSSRTGGGACKKVCSKGFVFDLAVLLS